MPVNSSGISWLSDPICVISVLTYMTVKIHLIRLGSTLGLITAFLESSWLMWWRKSTLYSLYWDGFPTHFISQWFLQTFLLMFYWYLYDWLVWIGCNPPVYYVLVGCILGTTCFPEMSPAWFFQSYGFPCIYLVIVCLRIHRV